MQIAVTFRHMETDKGVKDYVKEKVQRLQKYIENPREAHVVLAAEKFRHIADITIVTDGMALNSQGRDSDLYAAVDQMVERMERQIRERRNKVRRKRSSSPSKSILQTSGVSSEGQEETGVLSSIERRRTVAKPMTLEEAVAQLRASGKDFLIFINSDSGEMNVLSRFGRGKLEWVEPRRK
jgi:putative sigma-54 modulation protein